MSALALQTFELTKRFGSFTALDGVSLTVQKVEAIRVAHSIVHARSVKGETFMVALEDIFAAAVALRTEADAEAKAEAAAKAAAQAPVTVAKKKRTSKAKEKEVDKEKSA